MTLRLSDHAIRQYMLRTLRGLRYDEAEVELRALLARARPVRPGPDGAELWRVSGSGRKRGDRWRLIVADGQVVTVLPAHDGGRGRGGTPKVRP